MYKIKEGMRHDILVLGIAIRRGVAVAVAVPIVLT
jgi:hypothetical protein